MLQGLRSSRFVPSITVKTRDDLAAWVRESFGVRIRDKAVCPGHVADSTSSSPTRTGGFGFAAR